MLVKQKPCYPSGVGTKCEVFFIVFSIHERAFPTGEAPDNQAEKPSSPTDVSQTPPSPTPVFPERTHEGSSHDGRDWRLLMDPRAQTLTHQGCFSYHMTEPSASQQ